MRQKSLFTTYKHALTTAVVVLLVAAPLQALAKQMDARERPAITEELTLENEKCETDVRKFEGNAVARARVCIFVYKLDPAAESNDDFDYRVLWAQSNVNAVDGWCVQKTHTDIALPPGSDFGPMVPQAQVFEEATPATVTLEVPEDAAAGDAATLSKDVVYISGSIAPSDRDIAATENSPAHEEVRLTWTGSSDRKLGFAMGFQVAQPPGAPAPEISFGVRYPVKQATC